jgi:hypothetical protein
MADRRRDAEALLLFASETFVPNRAVEDRARHIEELGFSPFDAALSRCRTGRRRRIPYTDDDILRRARRFPGLLHVRVENPVLWYREVQL